MSKIQEVAFDDYVRRPENQNNTNVLRVAKENNLGVAALVDTLTEDAIGINATKTITDREGNRTTYTSRYPWWMVKDVKYEPTVVLVAPVIAPEPMVDDKPFIEKPKKSA